MSTSIFILFALNVATPIVKVDTIELGVYIPNHHFSCLTLSVATATVSVDIELGVHIANHRFSLFTLSVTTATVGFDTIKLGVYIQFSIHPPFSFCFH